MKKVFFVMLLAILLNPMAYSKDIEREESYGYFGVRVGYMEIDGIEDEGSANIGFTLGFRVSNPVAIEFSCDYHSSDFSAVDRTTYALQVSLLLYLTSNTNVQPYLVGGGGYYISGYDYWVNGYKYTDFTSHKFGGHLGAGVDIMLGDYSTITLDVRYIAVDEDVPREALGYDTKTFDGVLATVGAKFRF